MRRISFSMTERQFLDGTKDVTRRLGWKTLQVGDRLMACDKCMGLKKGQRSRVLGEIRVVSVKTEPLNCIDQEDCDREGFPELTPAGFIEMFCKAHGGKVEPSTLVRRIQFERHQCGS